jgi:hypothetical protein
MSVCAPGEGDGMTEAKMHRLPVPLTLFCVYLIAMLPVVVVIQSFSLLLSDDWTFGFADPLAARILGYSLFFILVAQHAFRLLTIIGLFLKRRCSLLNARIYLMSSFVMIVACALSMVVSIPSANARVQFRVEELTPGKIKELGLILIPALCTALPWMLVLTKSQKVRVFEEQLRVD